MDVARVELKLTVAASGTKLAKKRLGLTASEGSRSTIWFCDAVRNDRAGIRLALFDRGVIVRLRERGGGKSDSTVKYRRGDPFVLPVGWDPVTSASLKVEGDWTIHARTTSASLDSALARSLIKTAGADGPPLPQHLFSEDQRRFAAALANSRGVVLSKLRPLGPIRAVRWDEVDRGELENRVGAEQWAADELEFLELSMRVKLATAGSWLSKFVAWAERMDFDVSSMATTKTQAVLEHFANRAR